jgi:hypothetical protein
VLQKSKKYFLVIKYRHSAYHTKNWHSCRKRTDERRKKAILTKKLAWHPNVRVLQKSKKYVLVIKYRHSAHHTKNWNSSRKRTDERRKKAIFTKILIWHPNFRVLQKTKKYVLVIKYRHSADHTKNWHSTRKRTDERRKKAILTKKLAWHPNVRVLQKIRKYF